MSRGELSPGDRAVAFINNLTHTGDFNGEPFALRPWQADIIARLFGTVRPDGLRQYRRAFLALPRKQGKTELAAAILLYLLLGTGRRGQQIYSASGDHKQASLIFRAAATMVRNDPVLASLVTVYDGNAKRLEVRALDSFYESLSSEASLKHGLSPAAVLFDEVHVLPDRELHDVLTTGFGARREPLTIYITTAGWDRRSLCYELWDYARRVRDGLVVDPTFLPVLYEAAPDADWADPKVWHQVMPALGDFCSLEFMQDECRRAQGMPSVENTFRQLYLNQWTEQAVRWMSTEKWGACGRTPVDADALAGRVCYGGLDLSQSKDLTAFVLVFPGPDGLEVLCRAWAPDDGVWRNDPRTRDLYLGWHRDGHLTLTPGRSIDYQFVEQAIAYDAARYDLRLLLSDPAFASHICTRIRDEHGINVDFWKQTPLALNGPTRELERLVDSGEIRHGNTPVLAYCIANAAAKENQSGLIMLQKGRSTGRIDAAAALVNALAAMLESGDDGASAYESEGIFTL